MATSLLYRIESAYGSFVAANSLAPKASSTLESNPLRPDGSGLRLHTQLLSSKLSNIHRDLSRRRTLITTELEPEVGQLFEFLTTGLDSAASAFANFVTVQNQGTVSAWTRENIQDLEDSICFHGQTVSLFVEYMHLRTLGQDLNSHAELNRASDDLEDIGIELETKLKTLFDCCPAKLLPRSLEASPSSPQRRVPQSLNQSVTVSGILLAKLHDEALKYSTLFPHDVKVNELLGLALHWISRIHKTLHETPNGFDTTQGGRLYVDILKSSWITYCLRKHHNLRGNANGVTLVVCLLVKEVSRIWQNFDELDRNAFPIPDITQLPFLGDFEIRCPSYGSFEDRLSATRSQSQTAVQPDDTSLSYRPSISPEALPEEGEVELCNPEADYADPHYRPGFMKGLQSISSSSSIVPAQSSWTPSYVRIFKKPSLVGNFRIWTCQNLSNAIVDNQLLEPVFTELIPQYAFRDGSRTIWFRKGDRHCGLHYQFDPNSTDIFAFQSVFTTDIWVNSFPGVDAVSFYKRRAKSELQNATLQIWEEPDIEVPQITSQSAPTAPLQRRTTTRAEALEIHHSPSKMQIYCNYSIYTIYISERVECQSKGPRTIKLKPVRGSTVYVHIIEGTASHPAGIPLGGKTAHFADENTFRPFQSIDLEFHETAKAEFEVEFEKARSEWSVKRQKIIQQRQFQRNPVVDKDIFRDYRARIWTTEIQSFHEAVPARYTPQFRFAARL